jgi:L-amino acid N-acyltransferase YncA
MAFAARDEDEGLVSEPPPAPSVVAVVADRWARTAGRTWSLQHRVDVDIAPMRAEHAGQVLGIYQAGLDTGNASFETLVPCWERFDACHLATHRFVACDPQSRAVLGWVALAPISGRDAYRGVAEESIYVRPDVRRAGVGSALIDAVIASSSAKGIWTLQAGIFPENLASVALHRSHGFRVVGVRERIAEQRGRWRNMLLLERHDAAAEDFREHPLTVLR